MHKSNCHVVVVFVAPILCCSGKSEPRPRIQSSSPVDPLPHFHSSRRPREPWALFPLTADKMNLCAVTKNCFGQKAFCRSFEGLSSGSILDLQETHISKPVVLIVFMLRQNPSHAFLSKRWTRSAARNKQWGVELLNKPLDSKVFLIVTQWALSKLRLEPFLR